jgi:serine/threonine-protein kinase
MHLAGTLALLVVGLAPAATYQWPGGASGPLTWGREPPGRAGAQALELAFAVEAPQTEDPALMMEASPFPAAAHLDGRPVGLDPKTPGVVPLSSPGPHLLRLRFEGNGSFAIRAPIFGSSRSLISARLAEDGAAFALGVGLLTLGLVLALMGLQRGGRVFLSMAAFAFSLGALTVAQCSGYRALFVETLDFWRWVHALATIAFPIGLATFVARVFGDEPGHWLRRTAAASGALVVVAVGLDLAGLVPVHETKRWSYLLVFALVGLTMRSALSAWRRKVPGVRPFLWGFAAMVVVGLPDMLWGMGFPLLDVNTAHFGIFIFLVSLGAVVVVQNNAQRAALETSEGQLSKKMGDIVALNEELRHQVEMRSRQLKELLAGTMPGAGRLTAGSLRVGEVLDERYRIVRVLGRGAMGEVFEAERARDGRVVALKVLLGSFTATDAARFAREAELAAKVSHPNLVALLDVGISQSGVLYLVMEYVAGRTLEEARPEFGQPRFALTVLGGVAAGLKALHAAGITHRDLKPSNVLLQRVDGEEVARIADFGVAHQHGEAPAAPEPEADAGHHDTLGRGSGAAAFKLTRTGAMVGTPMYMAPEASRGEYSPRVDVFSFGLIAAEVLGAKYPFAQPPMLTSLRGTPMQRLGRFASGHAALDAVLERTLAAEAADRPDMAQVCEALDTAASAVEGRAG